MKWGFLAIQVEQWQRKRRIRYRLDNLWRTHVPMELCSTQQGEGWVSSHLSYVMLDTANILFDKCKEILKTMVTINQILQISKYYSQPFCFVFPNGIFVISCFDLTKRAVGYANWCPGLILPVPSFKVSPVTALRAMWFRIAKKPQNKIETNKQTKKSNNHHHHQKNSLKNHDTCEYRKQWHKTSHF